MDDQEGEAFRQFIEGCVNAVREVFLEFAMEYARNEFETALSPGGQVYETVLQGAIKGAEAWYGMFDPWDYKRTGSLSNPGNILITHEDIQANGWQLTSSWEVENVSPHAEFAGGWTFYRRKNRYGPPGGRVLIERPGGDLYKAIDPVVRIKITIPDNIAQQYYEQAVAAVFGS